MGSPKAAWLQGLRMWLARKIWRAGVGWAGVGWDAGFDQRVSDVRLDSFRGKLKGLASLVPAVSLLRFSFLDRYLSSALLSTIVRRTLDSGGASGDTSPRALRNLFRTLIECRWLPSSRLAEGAVLRCPPLKLYSSLY